MRGPFIADIYSDEIERGRKSKRGWEMNKRKERESVIKSR